MKPDHFVSVIIPVLNEDRFIVRCLDSVFAQDFPSGQMEIIVADGGSCDRTRETIAASYGGRKNLKVIANTRRSQPAGFNVGVSVARGDIIIRMDAHALYPVNYISNCINGLNQTPKIGNIGGGCDIQPDGTGYMAGVIGIVNKTSFGTGGAAFRVGGKAGPVDTVPFGCFRREVISQIGPMDETIPRAEDVDYNGRIIQADYLVYFDPAIHCTYFCRKTLSASLKQMYYNGASIGSLVRRRRWHSFSMRHLIPGMFVSSILLPWPLAYFLPVFVLIPLLSILLYAIVDLCASVQAAYRWGMEYIPGLVWAYALHHIVYGAGTLRGILLGR